MVFARHSSLNRNTFVLLITGACIFSIAGAAPSQDTDRFSMRVKNRLLTITAQNADIKNILSELSESTGISVSYPKSINRQITTKLKNVPLAEALKRLLAGMNYTVIYSFLEKKNRFLVSKIYVLPGYKGRSSPFSRNRNSNLNDTDRRIRSYERRILSLTRRIEKLDPNDRRVMTYERQIRNYRKILERLKRER